MKRFILLWSYLVMIVGSMHEKTIVAEESLVFVENDHVRLGIKPASGGGVAWISEQPSGKNLVNSFDRGRLIQQSYYGQNDGSLWNEKPWRWNPVQGGDWRGNGAAIIEQQIDADRIFVKSLPKHWATGENLTDTSMEQWITLHEHVVKIHFRFTYSGLTSHPPVHQELPAVFLEPELSTLVYYEGSSPWKLQALTRTVPGWPNQSKLIGEHWAAYVDSQDHGLGVYVPVADEITCYRYPPEDPAAKDACSYLAPIKTFAITPGFVWEYDAFFTIGTIAEIRERFGQIQRQATHSLLDTK